MTRKPLQWIDVGAANPAPDCERCFDYLTEPHMALAIASVGIERHVDVKALVDRYHANRHKEG